MDVSTSRGRGFVGGVRVRWHRRWGLGMRGLALTQGTMRLVRQALEHFGLGGALALGLGQHRWGGQDRVWAQ